MTARFHPLEQVDQLHDGYLRAFEIEGIDVVLVQQAGREGTPSVLVTGIRSNRHVASYRLDE